MLLPIVVTVFVYVISFCQGAIKNQADLDAQHQKALTRLQNVLKGNSANTATTPRYEKEVMDLYDERNPKHIEALREYKDTINKIPQQILNGNRLQAAESQEGGDRTVTENDISEVETFLDEVADDMKALMSNDQARDFLDKILDESNVLIESEDAHKSLQRIKGVVNEANELLHHKESRNLIKTCMEKIDSFFVDKTVHAQVSGLVDTTYKLATDPGMRKLKEETLGTLENLMDDEVGKAHLGLVVVHSLRTVQSMDAMNLALDALKGLNTLVTNKKSRSLILAQLGFAGATSNLPSF